MGNGLRGIKWSRPMTLRDTERICLVRDNGKRPDGLTLLPWNSGRSARWDVTVVDTLGSVYLQQSVITGASEAETTAVRKTNKYGSTTFPDRSGNSWSHECQWSGDPYSKS